MAKNYNKVCWNCGSKDMENKGEYVQCRSCGATYTDLPGRHAEPIETHLDPVLMEQFGYRYTSGSPSYSAIKKAALARQKAAQERVPE